eukprot:365755-Chlamydomonas_euryale.AAC.1
MRASFPVSYPHPYPLPRALHVRLISSLLPPPLPSPPGAACAPRVPLGHADARGANAGGRRGVAVRRACSKGAADVVARLAPAARARAVQGFDVYTKCGACAMACVRSSECSVRVSVNASGERGCGAQRGGTKGVHSMRPMTKPVLCVKEWESVANADASTVCEGMGEFGTGGRLLLPGVACFYQGLQWVQCDHPYSCCLLALLPRCHNLCGPCQVWSLVDPADVATAFKDDARLAAVHSQMSV